MTSFTDFIKSEDILIVEPSKAFSSTIQTCLQSLGIHTDRIKMISKYDEAYEMIQVMKPKVLICEYDIQGKNGLSLVEIHQKLIEDRLRVSLMISQNSSDAVVAEAAEEQVDGFLLKPFSSELFQRKVTSIIESKVKPTPYMSKISEGQNFVKSGQLNNAIEAFVEAKKLHSRPSLAHYYLGESFRTQKDMNQALSDFRSGRRHQPLHYKCLLGEFEVLVDKKQYVAANELIPILMKNFPLTPKRMTQIFIAAVYSKCFDNLPMCYEQYLKLEKKPVELTNIASLALYTGGKWYLQQRDFSLAVNFFEQALYISGRDITLLEKMVLELGKVGAGREAQKIFQKASSVDVGSEIYNRVAFEVDRLVLTEDQFFEKARRYYQTGIATKEQYLHIIRLFVKNQKRMLAESAASKAISQFSELQKEIYVILKDLL